MKLLKRALLAGALVVACCTAMAASAGASISPDPYSSSTDSGTFTTVTAFGTSICDLSGITGSLTGLMGGASGSLTGMTMGNCSGVIIDATSLAATTDPITVTLLSGVTTIENFTMLITTAFGTCLYAGTLTGTWTSPTRTIVAGSPDYSLVQALDGFCRIAIDIQLAVNVGSTISNP